MTTALTKQDVNLDRIFGDRPVHIHTCPTGNHQWKCNSPYCEVMQEDCPAHGGLEPIRQGREPWRGR